MAKYIVFEEIDRRPPEPGEWIVRPGSVEQASYDLSTTRPILRRLTDEEVAQRMAPHPADDERGRFVRECAMRLFLNIEARCMANNMTEGDWESRRNEFAHTAIADAESLAARVFGEKTK